MKVRLTALTSPQLNDIITPEEYIIWCARVSSPDNRLNHETAPKLLKYLIDSGHWSPFEMVSIGVEIETSRAIGTQLLRHRSFSFQEFSQRYSEVEKIEDIELRMQAAKNRQSSTDVCNSEEIEALVDHHIENSQELYNGLIERGIAKECARMILPLATQTTIIMHGTLRSWIHFLGQRCDSHAQKEAQEIALAIKKELIPHFPWLAAALDWS